MLTKKNGAVALLLAVALANAEHEALGRATTCLPTPCAVSQLGATPWSIDLNADGLGEVASSFVPNSMISDAVALHCGSTGNFIRAHFGMIPSEQLVPVLFPAADLNGDGRNDYAIASHSSSDTSARAVLRFHCATSGSLLATVREMPGQAITSADFVPPGDLDGDGFAGAGDAVDLMIALHGLGVETVVDHDVNSDAAIGMGDVDSLLSTPGIALRTGSAQESIAILTAALSVDSVDDEPLNPALQGCVEIVPMFIKIFEWLNCASCWIGCGLDSEEISRRCTGSQQEVAEACARQHGYNHNCLDYIECLIAGRTTTMQCLQDVAGLTARCAECYYNCTRRPRRPRH